MKADVFFEKRGLPGISGLFFAAGSFGIIDGASDYAVNDIENKTVYEYKTESVALSAEFEYEANGIMIRRDYFKNISSAPIVLRHLSSRFHLSSDSYEVYTQYNAWQHESKGEWQKLVTQVSAASEGIRTCEGAAPIMALCNLYNGMNTVFHLVPNAQWKMTAKKFPEIDKEHVIVETGFEDSFLNMTVFPGETIELPQIIIITTKNKTDFDAYKLHELYNRFYPRKRMPVFYNSWLYCFDKLYKERLFPQIDAASELGFEGFMIDAGWFGTKKEWDKSVGDWVENPDCPLAGGLIDISNRVREKGMIFGLWFEPERAVKDSDAVAKHPEYFIDNMYLDFANKDALEYIFRVICSQIDKYNVGWVKFDFNSSIPVDPSGNAFYYYNKGQKEFMSRLRQRYPELYITNCAGGGYRAELMQSTLSDSFWITDNMGTYEGVRIIKDTLKRMPVSYIERWNSQVYCDNIPDYFEITKGKMLNCSNGDWSFLIGTNDSFSKEFTRGGPVGFSCDIAGMPEKYKEFWKEAIEEHKQNRDFYMNAVCRLLVDTENITVLQYSDASLERVILQVFTKCINTKDLYVYPSLDEKLAYNYNGNTLPGSQLAQDGICFDNLIPNSCVVAELKKA